MKNVVSIRNNELMDNLEISGYPLKDMIKSNITSDYNNGIKFCELKVFPSDLNYIAGGQAKNWANGDILNIGDVIQILDKNGENILYYDNDSKTKPYYFMVIDARTIYEGQLLVELKLMEYKSVNEV